MDFKISDMLERQRKLLDRHPNWEPHIAEYGRDSLLYMVEEMGECIAIIKKKGDEAIMSNPHVRAHFVEECSDVMMYFIDMMDCFGITPEEFSEAYQKKWDRNMDRTWAENDKMYED